MVVVVNCGAGFSLKKATAKTIRATHMMINPGITNRISRNAPISSRSPAVEKRPTADLKATSLNERLKR